MILCRGNDKYHSTDSFFLSSCYLLAVLQTLFLIPLLTCILALQNEPLIAQYLPKRRLFVRCMRYVTPP